MFLEYLHSVSYNQKIGLCYYKTDLEISNVHLISTLVARLNVKNDLSLLVEKLAELAKKPSLSGFKFFAEEDSAKEQTGTIQIMTLHKSKGDEFDYVFIPELTEKNLSLDILSMGMSGDFKIAIDEGSTQVRIGTAIFGERIYN